MAIFQDSLGKLVPEYQTILDFATARDDRVAGVTTGTQNMCKAPVKSPRSTYQHSVNHL